MPCLSALTLFNLREMLEKSLEEADLGTLSMNLGYLVQGNILEGTMVCSVIKSDI